MGDNSPGDSAAQQAALLSLQAQCRLESVPPPRTVLTAVVQAWERLAAMAQLGTVKTERDALEAEQETFAKDIVFWG